jgi:arginine decarboxylase
VTAAIETATTEPGGRWAATRTITVASAVGQARTELAAFDQALWQMAAANFNLIRLSSVIPPGTAVLDAPGARHAPAGTWGDRLYVVYAEQRASEPGTEAWAGVGWVQDSATGRGLFVEHEGTGEGTVRRQIETSLADLQATRGLALGPPQMRISGATCVSQPICALVLCVYGSEPWSPPAVAWS